MAGVSGSLLLYDDPALGVHEHPVAASVLHAAM